MMKKSILTLLLLACATPTKPVSLTDIAYWAGTVTVIYHINNKVNEMAQIQRALALAYNKQNPDFAIVIPQPKTLIESAQELYNGGRSAVTSTMNTAQTVHALSNAQPGMQSTESATTSIEEINN